MTDNYGVITPAAATNYVLNPSAELASNFAAHNSATVTRDTTQARHGDYSYKIVPGGTSRGINLTLSALPNAAAYVTFYVYGTITGSLQVSLDAGSNYNTAAAVNTVSGSAVRYAVSVSQARANASVSCIIRNSANETFYIDAVQVESSSYYTTYFDGDLNGYCKWTGLRHGSTSTRDSQDRSGGREQTFDEFGLTTQQANGQGLPRPQHNLQPLSLQPGAVYQGLKVPPRNLELKLSNRAGPGTLAVMHSKLQDLINLIKPDLVAGLQPFRLFYQGANATSRRLYASFVYVSGLEGGGQHGGPNYWFDTPVALLAVDPYWYDDDRVTAALDFQDTPTAAYGLRRVNGAWAAMGSGFNGAVQAIVVDQERGRVYFGGAFTTANGVTVNRVTYWDGTTFNAMGGTPGAAGGTVYALALAANGDLWVGGAFTSAGGSTADGLARWNVATSTWTVFTNGTPGDTIYALAIDASGNLYGGGVFVNWDGNDSEDYIWKYNGTAFSALGTGTSAGGVKAIAVHPDGKVYVGGPFTTANGVTVNGFTYWNGTTFVAMGATAGLSGGSATVNAILVLRNGNLVITGDFTSAGGTAGYSNIAGWNGTTYTLLGTGLNNYGYSLLELPNGNILAGGIFSAAGGSTEAAYLALWNGYVWTSLDISPDNATAINAIAQSQGTLYIGKSTTAAVATAGIAAITNTGLSDCYPDVSIIGPSSSTAVWRWTENQTSGDVLYLGLTINTLETIGISFAPGAKSVSTVWSGRPGARQISGDGGKSASSSSGGVRRGPGSATLLGAAGGRFTGIIRGQPLPGSDFAAFHLQPGANTIAAFATGTLTGMVAVMHFTPRHLSVDGAAA